MELDSDNWGKELMDLYFEGKEKVFPYEITIKSSPFDSNIMLVSDRGESFEARTHGSGA